MSQNYKLTALVLACVAGLLFLSASGRTILLALLGMALLPVWGLLLASVFMFVCVILGAVILAVSDALEKRTQPAINLIDEPVGAVKPVVIVKNDEAERPRAA